MAMEFLRQTEFSFPRTLTITPVKDGGEMCEVCDKYAYARINTNLKVKVPLCKVHMGEHAQETHRLAEKNGVLWEDGWEIACDICRQPTDPPARRPYKPECTIAGMEAHTYAMTLCRSCNDMEDLFA